MRMLVSTWKCYKYKSLDLEWKKKKIFADLWPRAEGFILLHLYIYDFVFIIVTREISWM